MFDALMLKSRNDQFWSHKAQIKLDEKKSIFEKKSSINNGHNDNL